MIFVKNISLSFADQDIFKNVSCTLQKNEKIGLVGRNGAGKSTFLKVLDGVVGVEAGSVVIQKESKIAYMPQEVVLNSTKSVVDETLSAFADLFELEREKEKLFERIAHDATEKDMVRYADIEHELIEADFEGKKAQVKVMLEGLGFDHKKQMMSVDQLSVGWRMRIVLAKLLLQDADFYLFDEPTNHLDLMAKNWFLQFLNEGNFGYLIICHDRYFLDKVCDKIFELSLGNLTVYNGNFSYYVEQKRIREEHTLQAYEQQQRELKQKQKTIDRFRASSSRSAMAQSMIKALDKVEKIEIEHKPKVMAVKIPAPQPSGHYVLTVKNLGFGYSAPLFKDVSFQIQRGQRVALIAPNGTGKTTLFNLIAGKLKAQHGSIELGHNVSTALFDQDQEKVLDPHKSIFQEVCDTVPQATESTIRAMLGAFLFSGDDAYKLTKVLSGGERNRVAMTKVVLSKANFFLLDEPTNHLDIESKEIILQALNSFAGTILFVSHDQDFVNRLATHIVELTQNGVSVYEGNYDDYLAELKLRAELKGEQQPKKNITVEHKVVKSENKKELFELQKKAKNLTNKLTQNQNAQAVLFEKMTNLQYGSVEYQTCNIEFEKLQQLIDLASKELEELRMKIGKL